MADRNLGPAYTIHTDRLTLRCFELSDCTELQRVVNANRDHLLPWLPWAAQAMSTRETLDQVRKFRGWFDLDQDTVYCILDRSSKHLLGCIGLHRRAEEASCRHVGYWICQDRQGQGLVTEAVGALTRLSFEVEGLERIEIHCAASNSRSAAVPGRLGFTEEATLRQRLKDADGVLHDITVFTMLESEYHETACANVNYEARDGLSRKIK